MGGVYECRHGDPEDLVPLITYRNTEGAYAP